MFFRFLGHVVRRGWLVLLAAWIILLVVTWLLAPPFNEVAKDREFAFLPEKAPSRQAEAQFAKAFPDDRLASNIVLVLYRGQSTRGHLDRDLKFIEDDLEPGLRKIADEEGGLAGEPEAMDEPLFSNEGTPAKKKPEKRSIIARVRTPNAPGVGSLLVSPDHRALLVVVELTTEFLDSGNWRTIDKVNGLIADLKKEGKVPPGVNITLTGSAVIGRDHTQAELHSARATGVLTVVLVIVLLVLIYRAPLLALIPLATVYLAVQLSLNILALLGGAGYITLFQGIQIYITILAYGAGVDYCLFLTARYKEELDRGSHPRDAVPNAVTDVGHALVASAATVMCGIAMMLFAQFGKFREAGFAIPLSLLLVLLGTLTFSPALLRLAGRWAFWPYLPHQAMSAGHAAAEKPGELRRFWDWVGHLLLRRPGTVWLVTAALMAPFVVVAALNYKNLSYDEINNLPPNMPSIAGTRVLEEHFPPGMLGPVTVLLKNEHVDFSTTQGRQLVARLTDRLRAEKNELGLADVRSLTAPLGITGAAASNPLPGLDVPKEVREQGEERAALEHYTTDFGGRARIGTRLELILTHNPFSRQSFEDLDRIEHAVRDALPADMRQDSKLYVAGTTASVRDLAVVMAEDRGRIEVLVLVSVFVILIVLLHRVLVPLYLLLSVLFSYYVTMGVAFVVFWLLDPHGFRGIDWKVAVFLFTILIAVGEDYNIFLMTRIDEEAKRHGPILGVTDALARTGPIISSCGIIMAGTFGSLLAGSLYEMKQLGFALAFGVLLDTFVVRPILVPAFLILWRRRFGAAGGEGKNAPASEAARPTKV